MRRIALLTLLLLLPSCDEQNVQPQKPMYGDLSKAFDLLDADGREGAYVIAEDPETHKYVQFGIMYGDWMHFDFPSFVDKPQDFVVEHKWNIVTQLPEIDEASRNHFMEPDRSKELWKFLTDQECKPYYLRSVYEDSAQPIAATESICFNVVRADRDKCLFAASKAFKIVHGYPVPTLLLLTIDQTGWERPPEDQGEQ